MAQVELFEPHEALADVVGKLTEAQALLTERAESFNGGTKKELLGLASSIGDIAGDVLYHHEQAEKDLAESRSPEGRAATGADFRYRERCGG